MTYIENVVTVQNPLRVRCQLLCKTKNRKIFFTLICCYSVDKSDEFLLVYQSCG